MVNRVAIIDDNPNDLKRISAILFELSLETRHQFNMQFYFEFNDCIINRYDLYILDIDLPETNGFQAAYLIYEKQPDACIIFCTIHNDLVFDSFKLNPFYFVRKSFLQDDLKTAMRKYIKNQSEKSAEYLLVSRDITISIPFSAISYFEVAGNDLFIHTDNKEYKERKSMKQLVGEIPLDSFAQINQNYLVNLDFVKEISNHSVIMKNGLQFSIPRRNAKSVKDKYTLYLLSR
ncbi:MAG: response regulator transcription factor [Erysipelotrichaceae bacterium]|nr:response regulator transcription factor [Erysipelotrichaceae bacterium]